MDESRPSGGEPPNALREQREATAELREAAGALFGAAPRWIAPVVVWGILSMWMYLQMYAAPTGSVGSALWLFGLVVVSIAFGVVTWTKYGNLHEDLPELGRASRALEASRRAQAKVVRLASEQRSGGGDLSIASKVDGGDLAMVAEAGGVSEHEEVELDLGEVRRGEEVVRDPVEHEA